MANEGAGKDSHTREKIDDVFEGIPIEKIIVMIPTLRGNFIAIKKVEEVLHEVREATERDICTGGLKKIAEKAANNEIDCVKYTGLVNQLLRKGTAVLGDIPDGIDYSNDPNHHIAVYKFPEANLIGAKWTSNNPSCGSALSTSHIL
ncbi:hypothetical protein KAI54_04305 [Candidatus Gracilibacteria bacterium]|nr:hypothetical protein [Candidatus Gracilibacteria bacterium]